MAQVTHNNGELLITSAHDGIVWPLLFGRISPDKLVLVSGAANPDNRLCCWDATTGNLVWATREGELGHGCFDLAFVTAHDGEAILTAATEVGVQRWEAFTGVPLEGTGDLSSGTTIWGVDSYTPGDGRALLVGAGNDHLVYRWDALSGKKAGAPLAGHRNSVKCVASEAVPGLGVLIVSGSDDGTVRRWDAATGELIGVSDVVNADILDIDLLVSLTGISVLTCGDSDGVLHRWDAATGRSLGAPIETGEMVGSLVSADVAGEPRIIASSESGVVRQWHAVTGHLIDQSFTGMSAAATVTSDARVLLATGTEDGDIRLRPL